MKNMQVQQQCKGLFNGIVQSAFAIPKGVIFAESKSERPPVKDIWYDSGTSRYGYIDCPECDNRGCAKCMPKRRSIHRIKKSGLDKLLERCTFESFTTPSDLNPYAEKRTFVQLLANAF